MEVITGKAPAKLNLFLEVLGKRSDHYHELVSLACPITLHDELSYWPYPHPNWEFLCHTEEDRQFLEDIPQGEDNLVIRALNRLRERYCSEMGGKIRLLKRIPSQAGLGGGSSDAATALLLANESWNLGLSRDELAMIGAELGSDVPLFLTEKAVVFRGRGELLEIVPDLPQLHFVLLKPREGLSTGRVFAQMMERHDRNFREVEPVLEVLRANDLERFGSLLFNRLEEAAVSIWPDLTYYFRAFDHLGCLAVRMSGSGTCLFGLCTSEQHAQMVAQTLQSRQLGSVFQVQSIT